ncbi:hypothetical protein PISMIDRAFT_687072 [Pisolithus microcarpus 441]|uniref:Uncharacterized protein n=1 Tax=Pisolithus microcarpus 441 TaxID=765257 RepID=A0A0C9YGC3_9AGAM|nr:hypothetical protein PISMIDRAFT_687072 [Pisolithus microcarpus 441]
MSLYISLQNARADSRIQPNFAKCSYNNSCQFWYGSYFWNNTLELVRVPGYP